ncbi:MAG: hypothetical protein AAF564_22285 [Bacteroidota bacterium]
MMSKVDEWKEQIRELEQSLADLEYLKPPGTGADITAGKAEHLRSQIERYKEMIRNYDGDG